MIILGTKTDRILPLSRLIFGALILCMSGCIHLKRDAQQTETPPTCGQVLCTETNKQGLHLRLTVDLMSRDIKQRTLHKQFEMPYFERKNDAQDFRFAREILEWGHDHIVLAEVIPTKATDMFMLHVTSFEKSKHIKLTSSGSLLLRLCQDAEISIMGDKKFHSLKARLELVEKNNAKTP